VRTQRLDSSARRPLKVVRTIARLNVGGPARHAAILNDRLRSRGFDALLVHGTPSAFEGSLEQLAVERHLRCHHIPELGRRISLLSDVRVLARLIGLLCREQPDIVHTHTAKAGTLGRIAAMLYNATRARHRRCLVVHTFHGHVLTGYFRPGLTALVRLVERALARSTDVIITISARQRADIVERFAVAPSDRVVIVPLGLELDPLSRLDGRTAVPGEIVFGYVGRLTAVKDLPTLLRAMAIVARSSRARLVIIGDGELRSELQNLAARLGISERVQFVGWEFDLAKIYQSIDCLVLSSINEGTPVAVIEAMAAGVPVVATDVGGVPDVVSDGRTGSLVPPRDPEKLARAMLRLAEDPVLRARMSAAARADAVRRYGAERLADDIASLYRHGVERKRRRLQPED
jgi:glycosyltransferase involved in cell wall biosynthesis